MGCGASTSGGAVAVDGGGKGTATPSPPDSSPETPKLKAVSVAARGDDTSASSSSTLSLKDNHRIIQPGSSRDVTPPHQSLPRQQQQRPPPPPPAVPEIPEQYHEATEGVGDAALLAPDQNSLHHYRETTFGISDTDPYYDAPVMIVSSATLQSSMRHSQLLESSQSRSPTGLDSPSKKVSFAEEAQVVFVLDDSASALHPVPSLGPHQTGLNLDEA